MRGVAFRRSILSKRTGEATPLPAPEIDRRVKRVMETVEIEPLAARKPSQISGGERQRTALARSLVTAPRVLLLDEPLTGLDAELKAALVEDLRAWNALKRIPILYVTHSREEVDALGERVIAIDNGRVVSHGAPMDVLDAPRRKRLAQAGKARITMRPNYGLPR